MHTRLFITAVVHGYGTMGRTDFRRPGETATIQIAHILSQKAMTGVRCAMLSGARLPEDDPCKECRAMSPGSAHWHTPANLPVFPSSYSTIQMRRNDDAP
jgi:hypothetical protein